MRAQAVIGANYGDEGKGRTVDWLAAPLGPAALVVRSNGGAQAGHSVVSDAGLRHVFHHVGAGALRGARTHLSRFMVSHPILLAKEMAGLRKLGARPSISADPRGLVTTPWDMMVNQAVELARGESRHGSCGLGFGETLGRSENAGFGLTVADLHGPELRRILRAVRDHWLSQRLAELGIPASAPALEFARSEALLDRFEAQCAAFVGLVALRDDAEIGSEDAVIFEAAQGLLLDQNADGFPFLTRSNTGIANISAIAAETGVSEIEAIYASRCYLTRHGRGPMEDERPIGRWYAVDDPTNRPNRWQESLRVGLLDPAKLGGRIAQDIAQVSLVSRPALALSCLDQASGPVAWLEDGKVIEGPANTFLAAVEHATRFSVIAAFSSPANASVETKMQNVFY